MKKVTITCDRCSKDIYYDDGGDQWNIHVSAVPRYHKTGGGRYLVLRHPPLGGKSYEFCSVKCLKEWLKERE